MSRTQVLRLIDYWKRLGYASSWHVIRDLQRELGHE